MAGNSPTKHGAGGGGPEAVNRQNARFYYDWGNNPNVAAMSGLNGQYMPMLWDRWGVDTRIDRILGYKDQLNVTRILGYNEPERPDQANHNVNDAIWSWKQVTDRVAGTGLKLVSPAVSDTSEGRQWIQQFMNQVNQRNSDNDPTNNLQVDEVAFHWYGNVDPNNVQGSANNFLGAVQWYRDRFNKPVWITEFAGMDWGNNRTTEQQADANRRFLDIVVPELERRSYVRGHMWWQWGLGSSRETQVMEVKDGMHVPSLLGDEYVGTLLPNQGLNLVGQARPDDFIYMRGGSLWNNDASMDPEDGVGHIFALASHDDSFTASFIGGTADWGLRNTGTVYVAENALLRKQDRNTIQFRGNDIRNDGTIRLYGDGGNGGTLWIHGPGTNATGDGTVRVDQNTTLRLGNETDNWGFTLPWDMQLRGGTIDVDGVAVELTGDLQMLGYEFTRIDVQAGKDLTLRGSVFQAAGGPDFNITKVGDGLLNLAGTNSYGGATKISGGTLLVDGTTGLGITTIEGGATIAGSGTVLGDLVLANGSTLLVDLADALDSLTLDVVGNVSGAGQILLTSSEVPVPGTTTAILTHGTFNGSSITLAHDFGLPGLDLDLVTAEGISSVVASAFIDGDANLDGTVSILDFALLRANFGSNGNWRTGDFNGDGTVSILDFAILRANFGNGLSGDVVAAADLQLMDAWAATVPEPTSLGGVLLLGGLLRRRQAI